MGLLARRKVNLVLAGQGPCDEFSISSRDGDHVNQLVPVTLFDSDENVLVLLLRNREFHLSGDAADEVPPEPIWMLVYGRVLDVVGDIRVFNQVPVPGRGGGRRDDSLRGARIKEHNKGNDRNRRRKKGNNLLHLWHSIRRLGMVTATAASCDVL